MKRMTLEMKVRTWLTVAMLVVMGAAFAREAESWTPVFTFGCGMAGLWWGIYRRRDKPQPGMQDIEADWTRRAQAGAFVDSMQLVVPVAMIATYATDWGRDAPPFLPLVVVTLVALLDYGVRYWILRVREQ